MAEAVGQVQHPRLSGDPPRAKPFLTDEQVAQDHLVLGEERVWGGDSAPAEAELSPIGKVPDLIVTLRPVPPIEVEEEHRLHAEHPSRL